MNYLLLLAYDGTAYHGWQSQLQQATIAGTLEDTFASVFSLDMHLQGASRTDAGVHALGQVAHVETSLEIDPSKLRQAWNGRLPQDIHIRKAIQAPPHFHPRAGVGQKTYYYHFFLERPLPFVARYGTICHRSVDIEKLKECLTIFVGTHNFRSFCTGNEKENTIRVIDSIKLLYLKRWGAYRIIIQGAGFLRHMIRRIVGACLECAIRREIDSTTLLEALSACNPHQKLPTADACGLLLHTIEYINSPWEEQQ